jgi:hypothetical protein
MHNHRKDESPTKDLGDNEGSLLAKLARQEAQILEKPIQGVS